MNRLFILAAFAAAFIVYPLICFAHPLSYGSIRTFLSAKGNELNLATEAPLDLIVDQEYAIQQKALFNEVFNRSLEISNAGRKCRFEIFDLKKRSDRAMVTFTGKYVCPGVIKNLDDLSIKNILFIEYFENYDHFVELRLNGEVREYIFNPVQKSIPLDSEKSISTTGFWGIVERFLAIGIEHILLGYDHILFFLSIILLVTSVRRIIALISVFTLAHSITLILAGFEIVSVPAQIVEPVIAISIAYVALRNLYAIRKDMQSDSLLEKQLTVFVFGLVHGLGFASAITEASIPDVYFIPALLSFNIGIEVGQLGLLFGVLPLLTYWKQLPSKQTIFSAVSGLILVMSMVWFFERII